VIVDQLARTDPNPQFVDDATTRLEAAGYRVDYISDDAVDVDMFRGLAKRGYDVILIRNHVGQLERRSERVIIDTGQARALVPAVINREVATFFTNEEYDRGRYIEEQIERSLGVAYYPPPNDDGKQYFGVTPEFIGAEKGDYDGALVILMGCGGAGSQSMAQAFLDRGAKSVVSWTGLVTARHTDEATVDLLDRLLADEPVAEAVTKTMAGVGPDPSFGATLRAYE
jgi:vacuolar-type H+-ATPase subunit F/Vma7